MCNGEPTYITGEHYFFCNYHSIDTESGFPDFRHSNRIWFYFWEACKADDRCYGMCYLKNRRSGFSHMAASMAVNTASKTKRSHIGICLRQGRMQSSSLQRRSLDVAISYRSSLNLYKQVWINRRRN